MRKLTISSVRGGLIDLLNDDHFHLVNFDAETKADVSISSYTVSGYDGDIVNNIQALPRTATLELQIKSGVSVEMAKRHILQVIKPKELCTFTLEQEERKVQLQGYVETIYMPRYQLGVVMSVGFYCTQPYWEDVVEVFRRLSNIDDLHYFTTYPNDMLILPEEGIPLGAYNFERYRQFRNDGDAEVGITIYITAVAKVTNPVLYADDGTYIGVNTTMEAEDVIIITTHKGNKTITKNGVNILDTIMAGSTWLQLPTGVNAFNFDSDDEELDNCYFEIAYKQRYV